MGTHMWMNGIARNRSRHISMDSNGSPISRDSPTLQQSDSDFQPHHRNNDPQLFYPFMPSAQYLNGLNQKV